MMRVGDRHGERIRCVRTHNLHTGKEPRDHRVDLCFFRSTRANNSFFDQPRGIFADNNLAPRRREQDDAARMGELQRRLGVGVDEDFLDRCAFGIMFDEQVCEQRVENIQPLGQRHFGIGLDLAIGDVAEAIALRRDDAPASRAEAGIEAEDDQPSFSITSSGTS